MSYIQVSGRSAGIFNGLGGSELPAKMEVVLTNAMVSLAKSEGGAIAAQFADPIGTRATYNASGKKPASDQAWQADALAAYCEANASKTSTNNSGCQGILAAYATEGGGLPWGVAIQQAKANPLIAPNATSNNLGVVGYFLRSLIADIPSLQLSTPDGTTVVAVPDATDPNGAGPQNPGGGVTPPPIVAAHKFNPLLIVGGIAVVGVVAALALGHKHEVRTNPRRRRRRRNRRR